MTSTVEQAQGYLINVNLFGCALTERKPKEASSITPLYCSGVMGQTSRDQGTHGGTLDHCLFTYKVRVATFHLLPVLMLSGG